MLHSIIYRSRADLTPSDSAYRHNIDRAKNGFFNYRLFHHHRNTGGCVPLPVPMV